MDTEKQLGRKVSVRPDDCPRDHTVSGRRGMDGPGSPFPVEM